MLSLGNPTPTPARSSLTFGAGKLVMVTLRGSRTAMARGACSFSTSRAHASSRCGSIVAWATVTPTYGTACRHHAGWETHPPAPSHPVPGTYPGTEVVDGLGREASPAQGCQREEPWVIPVPEKIPV